MFWASELQKTLVGITVFFAPRVSQKRENTTYLTIFGHYETKKKVEGVTATTTTTSTNNHNHNDNSNSESNRASGRTFWATTATLACAKPCNVYKVLLALLHWPANQKRTITQLSTAIFDINHWQRFLAGGYKYPYIHTYIYIYIMIRVQIRGRSCAEDFDRYKTQSIGCATTKFDAWYLFCSYKIQNTT